MCRPLVTLALEVATFASPVRTAVRRYAAAARDNARRAEAEERAARDRLLLAYAALRQAPGASPGSPDGLTAKLEAARIEMDDAARSASEAILAYTFAEQRLAHFGSEPADANPPTDEALQATFLEHRHEADEIAGTWDDSRQPARDRALLADVVQAIGAFSEAGAPGPRSRT